MKYVFILFIAITLLVETAYVQAPDTLWTKTYGGSNNDYGYYIQLTSDSGYIIVGYTESYGAGKKDVYLIKTNAEGKKEWQRTYGGRGNDEGKTAQQVADGGYIIVGYTESYGADNKDIYLIKTDTNGDEVWHRTFGGKNYD